MKLQEIKNLITQGRYDEAFEECSKLLQDPSEDTTEILRVRAHGYARSGDYFNAVRDYETIVDGGVGNVSDYYLAAYNALYIDEFEKSQRWFGKVLTDGENNSDNWFRSAVLFYLAFIRMQQSEFEEAANFLDLLQEGDSEIGLPLPGAGMCTRTQLRNEIERRRSGRSAY